MSSEKQLRNFNKLKALVIGYGSIGKRHVEILSSHEKVSEVFVLSSQKKEKLNLLNNLEEALKVDPDYFVVCSPTSQHYAYAKKIDELFSKKVILIEKPLFSKKNKFKSKSNTFFIGYNLRFHPVLSELKKMIKGKEIFNVSISCNSYLPKWRKNINYQESSSAKKSLGGGVLLDLSHEIDYMNHIFGEVEPFFKFNSKISNLEIETDDYLNVFGKFKNRNAFLQLELSYFSHFEKREILVSCNDISIKADLIMNTISSNKGDEVRFPDFNISDTYQLQHEAIFDKKHTKLCSLEEGLRVMDLIEDLRI